MEVVKREPVRVTVKDRAASVRAADAIIIRDGCVYYPGVEVKLEKYGTVFIPWGQLKGSIKHLFDEVNLEKEYD